MEERDFIIRSRAKKTKLGNIAAVSADRQGRHGERQAWGAFRELKIEV